MDGKTYQIFIDRLIYICLIISIILSALKSYDSNDSSWSVCLLPTMIAIILLIPSSQLFISFSCLKVQKSSLILILFSLYAICLSLFAFALLSGLKLDEVITDSWYYVVLPLWFAIFVGAFIAVFMFPGMLDPTVNLIREAWTLLFFMIAAIVSVIMYGTWLQENSPSEF